MRAIELPRSTNVRLTLPATLRDGEILIVEARLSRSLDLLDGLREHLDSTERARADRFLHSADTSRMVLGRGIARAALGALMRVRPAAVEFAANAHGKPEARGGPAFNVSHSGDVVLVAIAAAGRVGVDVEHARELRDMESLARSTFRAEETAAVLGAPEGDRRSAFYRVWTRKEAILKALGVGLTALDSIEVSASAEGPPLRSIALPGEQVSDWTVLPVLTDPEHPAALAADRPVQHLTTLLV